MAIVERVIHWRVPTDAEWKASIAQAGKDDAEDGNAFCPEQWTVDVDEQALYTFAFLKVRPDCGPAREWADAYTKKQADVDYTEPEIQ